MKNYFFVFLFLIAFASNAQNKPAFGVYYNPSFTSRITQANSDLNWLKKEWDKLESGSVGYSVGAFAERTLSSKLSLRAGVGFSTFGERVDSLSDFGIDKYKTDYRFMEVPFVASYYFGENKNVRLFRLYRQLLWYSNDCLLWLQHNRCRIDLDPNALAFVSPGCKFYPIQ